MRWILLILIAGLTGCSNAPLAGFLDTVKPSKPAGTNADRQLPPPVIDPARP